ncbi:MAG: DUF6132 family protein [Candidatus Kapaibacterium sp.]
MMNTKIKILLFMAAGAVLGYAYFHFFGCETNCTLKSDWRITSLYGSVIGLILAFPTKRKSPVE